MFRQRFADAISRQLDVFAEDEAQGLLREVSELKQRYDGADRSAAEESYGDYADVVDAVKEALADMRDRFASTLDEQTAEAYSAAFEKAARKRWRWLA